MLVAVSIKQAQTFTGVMQMFVMPMFFVSGAFFPVSGLPTWLGVLNRIDPLTYAVDPMRRLVFDHLDISESARRTLDPGVSWWGWHVPALVEAGMVLVLGLALLGVAIWRSAAPSEPRVYCRASCGARPRSRCAGNPPRCPRRCRSPFLPREWRQCAAGVR